MASAPPSLQSRSRALSAPASLPPSLVLSSYLPRSVQLSRCVAIPENDIVKNGPLSQSPAGSFPRPAAPRRFSVPLARSSPDSLANASTSGSASLSRSASLPRKEVIQPHLPIRLPCYDFTPVIGLTFGSWPLSVTTLTSGAPNSHGVTGGVYKARERIHRGILIRDY